MVKEMNLDINEDVLMLSIYLHDIFAYKSRKEHHKLAYEYILQKSDKYLQALNDSTIKVLAFAALEHRASIITNFTTIYSQIVSIADKGKPNFERIILRCYETVKNNFTSQEELVENIIAHINEKFGRNGKLSKHKEYAKYYHKELEQMYKEIEDFTKNKNNYYRQLLEGKSKDEL